MAVRLTLLTSVVMSNRASTSRLSSTPGHVLLKRAFLFQKWCVSLINCSIYLNKPKHLSQKDLWSLVELKWEHVMSLINNQSSATMGSMSAFSLLFPCGRMLGASSFRNKNQTRYTSVDTSHAIMPWWDKASRLTWNLLGVSFGIKFWSLECKLVSGCSSSHFSFISVWALHKRIIMRQGWCLRSF